MNFLEKLRDRARKRPQKLVFPEGNDVRVIQAALTLQDQGIARALLLGSRSKIEEAASGANLRISSLETIEPEASDQLGRLIDLYLQRRRHKGVTLEDAEAYVRDPVAFGAETLDFSRGGVSTNEHGFGGVADIQDRQPSPFIRDVKPIS